MHDPHWHLYKAGTLITKHTHIHTYNSLCCVKMLRAIEQHTNWLTGEESYNAATHFDLFSDYTV